MKKRMKSRFMAVTLSLLMMITMVSMMNSDVYARSSSTPEVIITGDTSNFANEAPISTITIDRSKIHKDNLVFAESGKLDQLPNSGSDITFTFEDGYVYAEGVTVNADYKRLGNFTFVYEDAATMPDGTKADLEVIFDEIHLIRENTKPYYSNEKVRIAYAGDSGNGKPLALTPLSVNHSDKHFAIRSEIKFRINKAGDVSDEQESFFFTASDINIKNNFSNIANDHGNQNYSESIEPMYGINSESDVYLPLSTNLTDNPSSGGWYKTDGGYHHRFMVNSKVVNPSSNPYDYGLGIVVRAGGPTGRIDNGFITRAWASAGPDFEQSEIHFMAYDLTHSFTSSSGANGSIVLWTDGQIHDTDAEENRYRKLDGGTMNLPHTYAVPRGKEVTYKMAADEGYVIDTLTVNGAPAEPTSIVYKEDSSDIDYYEYTFSETAVNKDQTIAVTWKEEHILTKKDRIDPTCTNTGREAYWECQICKKLFSDSEGNEPIEEPEVIPALNHKWDGGKVTTFPTTEREGVRTYTCQICKAERTEAIDKLPLPIDEEKTAPDKEDDNEEGKGDHNGGENGNKSDGGTRPDSGKDIGKKAGKVTAKTGDESHPILWFALLGGSMLVLLGGMLLHRRYLCGRRG